MSLNNIITQLQDPSFKSLLQEKSIQHLWIFGSRAKQTPAQDSDVDLLYQLDSTASQSHFAFFSAISLLRERLGLPVDMTSIDNIHPDIA